MSVEGKKTEDKIGDMKVQTTKMKPNVPNKELSTKDFTLMSEAEVSEKLDNIVYKPKKPKGK